MSSSARDDKQHEEDRALVDAIALKPMDAWTSMDKMTLLGMATIFTQTTPSHAPRSKECEVECRAPLPGCKLGECKIAEQELEVVRAFAPSTTPHIDEDLDEILTEAINVIDNEAQVLFESNCDTDGNWGTEEIDIEAKRDYDQYRAFACRIDDKRKALRAASVASATTRSDLESAVNIGLAALGHFNTEQTDKHWNAQERVLREIQDRLRRPDGGNDHVE